MFTATRVVAASVLFALVGGSLLLAPNLLTDPLEPVPVASPSTLVSPDPSSDPEPVATISPTRVLVETAADSTFAATRVLTELEPGADPTSLSAGPFGRPVFVDRASGRVYEVGPDGYPVILATARTSASDDGMAAPVLAFGGGNSTYAFDAEGRGWWGSRDDQSEAPWMERLIGEPVDSREPPEADTIDPATTAFASLTRGPSEYDLYLAEPDGGDIIRYDIRRDRNVLRDIDGRIERDGLGDVLGLHADHGLWVLSEDGVEHWLDGARDEAFVLGAPPSGAPDYRFIGGTGSGGKGQLWLYDVAGRRFVSFDKRDGRYLGSWAPGPGAPTMSDVRGMFVGESSRGAGPVVTWMTPDEVMLSAVSRPAAIRPEPEPHEGGLTPSSPEPDSASIVWSAEGVSLEADSVRIRAGDKVFTAPGEVLVELDDGTTDASLEMTWYESGTEMRLFIYMASDGTHWWIYDLWTYDGVKGNGEWIYYDDLAALTRTPLGQPLAGDLRLDSTGADRKEFRKDGTGKLRIVGLRLTAFPPRVRPAPLEGCEYLDEPVIAEGEYLGPFDWMQGPGEPMEGIMDMTPREAEALLQELGWCYRFDHEYRLAKPFRSKKLNQAFYDWTTDVRCSAPEHGKIELVSFLEDRRAGGSDGLIATVYLRDQEVRDLPEPPPRGTDRAAQ